MVVPRRAETLTLTLTLTQPNPNQVRDMLAPSRRLATLGYVASLAATLFCALLLRLGLGLGLGLWLRG
jgi:hypothetical protein